MRIGILTDGGEVSCWQAHALRDIAEGNEFIVYESSDPAPSKRRPVVHGLYYLLNLLAIRGPQTASVPLPPELLVTERVIFRAETDGAWQRLPASLLSRIAGDRPDVILKFGMGLLRVPTQDQLAAPILSYHHGDPRSYRGRPAGFHEMLAGETELGQIIQILSNQLDAGRVVAFAQTKVHPHSYRATLNEAYRCSALILRRGIENASAGRYLPIEGSGKNYRLPGNRVVLGFMLRLFRAKLRRLAYGAFVEKKWQVATAPLPDGWSPNAPTALGDDQRWQTLAQPALYDFLADPFYDPTSDGVLAEAMGQDGRGVIVRMEGTELQQLPIDGGHCSYPATITCDGRSFLVPETSGWSGLKLFELSDSGLEDRGALGLPGHPRILDPTLHRGDDGVFLFGNLADEGDGVLRLWVADSLFDAFDEHADSPIRISPAGGRMGGLILAHDGSRYRVGQDFRRGYGDGLVLFRIDELSRHSYRESEVGKLRFEGCRGPHTLNLRGPQALFDYYEDRFSLFAGLRRLKQRRAASFNVGPMAPSRRVNSEARRSTR